MARMMKQAWVTQQAGEGARALGVNAGGAVLLYPTGQAQVVGTAYWLSLPTNPTTGQPLEPAVCQKGDPLTYGMIIVRRIRLKQDTFNFADPWTKDVPNVTFKYTISLDEGEATSDGNPDGRNWLY